MKNDKSAELLEGLRAGRKLSLQQQLLLIIHLSVPAIFAQISNTLMHPWWEGSVQTHRHLLDW